MTKKVKSSSRFMLRVFMVVALLLSLVSLAACSPKTEEAADTTDAKVEQPADTKAQESTASTAETPAPAAPTGPDTSYTGTDPEQVLTAYCSLAGCHKSDELTSWVGKDENDIIEEMDSMAMSSEASEEQIQVLIEYYKAKL